MLAKGINFLNPQSIPEIIFVIIGGLGLFLFGLRLMSDTLKNTAGKKLRTLVQKVTGTPFKAMLTGILVTVVIQSSSGTSVIVVSLVSAGLMSLPQAMGVLVGSTIGTTVTAFLVGFNIEQIALPILFVGSLILFLVKNKKATALGFTILGFGILFLGLNLMGSGFHELSTHNWFKDASLYMGKNPSLSIILGTVLTAFIQSSAAFISIVQKIFETKELPLVAAMGAVIGANLGTLITAFIASIKASREAKQTVLGLLFIKLVGVIIFAPLLRPTAILMAKLDALLGSYNKLTIAFYHLFFNLVTAFIVIWFVKYLVILVTKIMPVKSRQTSLDKLTPASLDNATIALDISLNCIQEMSAIAREMFSLSLNFRSNCDEKALEEIRHLESLTDEYDNRIHDYLIKIHTSSSSEEDVLRRSIYLDVIRDLERISDHALNLTEFYEDRFSTKCHVNEILKNNLDHYFTLVASQLDEAITAFLTKDKVLAQKVMQREKEVDELERKYRTAQINLIAESKITNEDLHYVDILANLERISDHCENIAQGVINPLYISREIT